MNEKPRAPEPTEALLIVLLSLFGVLFLTLSVASLFYDRATIEEGNVLTPIFLYGKILFIIVPVLYCRHRGYDLKKLFRFTPVSTNTLAMSAILGISLLFITDEIERLISLIIPVPESIKSVIQSLKEMDSFEWTIIFIGSALVIPVAEEVMFRGFLQGTLEEKGDITRAVVLSSVSWALIHLNPFWAIPIFVIGVFLGWVAWRTRSLIPAIVLHATQSIAALIMIHPSMDESLDWYMVGDHVSPIVLLFAAGGVYYAVKTIDAEN